MSPATAAKVLDFPLAELVSPADVQKTADEVTRAALQFVEDNKVAVVDIATCERAVQARTAIGQKQQEIVAKLEKPKSWAYNLHKWFCSLEAAALAPYNALDTYERDQIRTFNDAQTRLREQRERELADQARRDAEARAAAEAAALETSGDHAMAVAVMEEAIAAPTPVVTLPTLKTQVAGLSTTRRWLWRYPGATNDAKTSPPAIVARTMSLAPREFLKLDEQKVGAYVRTMKTAAKIPGIEVYWVDDPVR